MPSRSTNARERALPAAVVFDCDGTLVDSETVTRRSMALALAEQGVTLSTEDFSSMVGHPWPRTRERMRTMYGMDDTALATYEVAMRTHAIPMLEDPALVFDDVVATLDELAAADVPLAVCTSSGREHLGRVLSLPGLVDRFAVLVAREDTTEHKPSGVPYARALDQLRERTGSPLPAARCTVVEDSAPGVHAGLAAGCWTVAVDRGADLHDLSHADRVVDRLSVPALLPGAAG